MGIIAWIAGGGLLNLFETYALHTEMADYPGGGEGLAASVRGAAELMRPLRWPADRLDTLGGYLTYHNIMLFQGFLALYATVQGVHAIRELEARGSLDVILTSGRTRLGLLRDRAVGDLASLALIVVGLAITVAASLAFVGEPDTGGALLAMTAVGLCALAAYALGLAIAQWVPSARGAMGTAVVTLITLYVLTNEWENIGPVGVVRFVSPFHWANSSRALVPGVGWSAPAMLVLLAMAVAGVGAAAQALQRRDLGAVPAHRGWIRLRHTHPRIQRAALRHLWSGALLRHRAALMAWVPATAAFALLWTGLQATVVDAWNASAFMKAFLGGSSTSDIGFLYTSYGCDLVAAIVIAYTASLANGWVADLRDGRLESLLATPLTWGGLMRARFAMAFIGVGAIVLAWVVTVMVVATVNGVPWDGAGLVRTTVMSLCIGWAGAALAATLVSWTRATAATTGIIVYVVGAYTLGWFVQVLHWPGWLNRLSVFSAFGHPYQAWPDLTSMGLLIVVGLVGSLASVAIADRGGKVAA